ncbi:MAG: hypothetical protein AXA67_08385 [Methylothermaceae bacteria B42]|nr:MAG: hypothetical protein AXA67_08385 [Methylothermaceae bacteria B42]HHJ40449.1 DUF4347 domain-containing protein [Methylothermaceae bacterium]
MKPKAKSKQPHSPDRRQAPLVEALEPRFLYSADILGAIDLSAMHDPLATAMEGATSLLDQYASYDEDSPDPIPPQPPASDTNRPQELVFIDTATPDYQTLLDDLTRSANAGRKFEIILITPDENGIDVISQTLAQYRDISAVHVISHGQPGQVALGNTTLDPSQLAAHADTIASWKNALSGNADWLIYGCSLAATSEGIQLIDELSRLTDADVAASDDLTGNAAKGGDWDLEYQRGTIEAKIAVSPATQATWNGVLDIGSGLVGHWTLDSDTSDSSGNGNDGTLMGDAAINNSSSTNNVGPGKVVLDGTGDYVNLDSAVATVGTLTEGSVTAWVQTSDSSSVQAIFSISDKGDKTSYSSLGINKGNFFFDIAENGTYKIWLDTNTNIADGTWHHIAVTVDSSGNSLYVDGNKLTNSDLIYSNGDATTNNFLNTVLNSDTVAIGAITRNSILEWELGGLVDDVRVYNRALTAGEIAQLYNFQNPPTDITLSQSIPITINNPGFESQTLANDVWTTPVTDWDISGTAGVGNPDPSAYQRDIPEGSNIAYLDESPSGNTLSQTLTKTLQAGESYTLSAWIGDEYDSGYDPSGWEMRLYAGNQLLGSVGNNDFDPAEGTFKKATLHLDADTLANYSSVYNQPLKIEFYNTGSTTGEDIHIDNVQLEYTSISVPENAANGTVVADVASVTDPNVGDTFTYALTDDAGGRFAIDNNGKITVANGTLLDYESATSHDITIRVTDSTGLTYDEVVTIQVGNVNEAPVNHLPANPAIDEDNILVFTGANQIQVSDADLNGGNLEVNLNIGGNAFLNLGDRTGLTFSMGDGIYDRNMTFTGTQAAINAALQTLQFIPDPDFNGTVNFTITTNDLGNSGSDPGLTGDASSEQDQDTFAITVNAVNDSPTVGGASLQSIQEDTANPPGEAIGGLLASSFNDVDVGSSLAGILVTHNPENASEGIWQYSTDNGGTWFDIGTIVSPNALALDVNSKVRFIPAADYHGTPAGLSFRALDNTYSGGFTNGNVKVTYDASSPGGTSPISSSLASINTTISSVNDAPILAGIESTALSYIENDPVTAITSAITLSDVDDTNIESAVIQITGNYQNSEDVLSFANFSNIIGNWDSASGTLTLSGSDTLANYQAALRSVTYINISDNPSTLTRTVSFTVNDGSADSNAQTRNITVTAVNDAPFLFGIENTSVVYSENDPETIVSSSIIVTDTDYENIESATVQITGNYQNGEDELHFTNIGNITGNWDASSGTLTLSGPDIPIFYQSALQSVTYVNTSNTPSPLTRTVTFTVNDGTVDSNIQTRNITITPINDEQSLDTNAGLTLDEEATATITNTLLSTSDVEQGPAQIVYTITAVPANGALKLNGTTLNNSDAFTQDDIDNGRLVYAHNGSETIADSFNFTVDDGFGAATAAIFNITVNPVNDAPVAVADNFSVAEGSTTTLNVAGNDYDPDDGLDLASIAIDTAPLHGTLTVNNDGTVDYHHDGSETASDGFVYSISDKSGAVAHSVLVTLSVTPVNDAPIITSNGGGATAAVNVAENQTPVTTVTATDMDSASLTYGIAGGADNAKFTIDSTTGALSFASAPDFENPADADGNNIYEVIVQASDGSLTDSQTISVTVSDVNDEAPAFTSSPIPSATEGSPYVYNIVTSDPDAGSTLTITTSNLPHWLNLTDHGDGTATLSGTPANSDAGDHSIILEVSDGALTATQTFTLSVSNTNTPPTGVPTINGTPSEDQTLTADTSSIADGDGLGPFNYQWLRNGAVIPSATSVSHTLGDDDVNAQISVQVSYTDGDGNLETLTSSPAGPVANVNDSPTGAVTINKSNPVQGDTLGVSHNLADADGFPGTVNYQWQRDGVNIPGAADASYTVTSQDIGRQISVTLSYTDGHGTVESVTSVPITPINSTPPGGGGTVNAPPVINSDGGDNHAALEIPENQIEVTTVTATDPEGDKPTFVITGGADQHLFQIDPETGRLSFVAPPNYETPTDQNTDGIYAVEVTAWDSAGGKDIQQLSVTVTNVNEAPAIISSSQADLSAGESFQYQISASDPNGNQKLVFTTTNLPSWLKLENQGNGTAILKGKPEAADAGAYSFTLTVSDGEMSTAQTFSFQVSPADSITDKAEDGNSPGETNNPEPEQPVTEIETNPEETVPEISSPQSPQLGPNNNSNVGQDKVSPDKLALLNAIDPAADSLNSPRQLSPAAEDNVGKEDSYLPPSDSLKPIHPATPPAIAGDTGSLLADDFMGHNVIGRNTPEENAFEGQPVTPLTEETQATDTSHTAPESQYVQASKLPPPLVLDDNLFANLTKPKDGGIPSGAGQNQTDNTFRPFSTRLLQTPHFHIPNLSAAAPEFLNLLEDSAFAQELDLVQRDIDEAAEKQVNLSKLSSQTVTGISLALTAGAVHWALRPNSLMAGLLSALPFWKQLDPLPILGTPDSADSGLEPLESEAHKPDGGVETLFENGTPRSPDTSRDQP